jgi:erythromycin esterase-like protein
MNDRQVVMQIKEKGFDFIAVEGDWPDCGQVR